MIVKCEKIDIRRRFGRAIWYD